VLGRHVDAFEDFGGLNHSSRPQFALEHSEVTVFKSVATPQLCGDLVQELLDNLFHNHSFLARPIAGTRPRGKDADEDNHLEADLLADPKERAEHNMRVDLARNDVGIVAKPGTVELKDLMSVEPYSHVMHIVSSVTGELQEGMTAFDALRASLPVGTVSGAPKIGVMQILDEMERTRRGP
jgi:anthranilate/para-aminobenzoate synthase component I